MAHKKKVVEPLPTIWEVNDELWSIIQSILDELDPPAHTGRPRARPERGGGDAVPRSTWYPPHAGKSRGASSP